MGVPERADARDSLCGGSPRYRRPPARRGGRHELLRRRAQLLAARADLEVGDVRGNVDTRLRQLADGDYDAVVLAAAGLARLGLPER